jgi:hypothetical protein
MENSLDFTGVTRRHEDLSKDIEQAAGVEQPNPTVLQKVLANIARRPASLNGYESVLYSCPLIV